MRNIGIIGAQGRLGKALVHRCSKIDGFEVVPFARPQMDLAEPEAARRTLFEAACDLLINCAALTDVDFCETHPVLADQLNGRFPADLGWVADRTGARVLQFSTDYVFDGQKREPYLESDPVAPKSHYGRSKWMGEQGLLEQDGRHLVLRVSWLYGAARPAFPEWIIGKARQSVEPLPVVGDKWACPTCAEDVARLIQPCLLEDLHAEGGIYHLCNGGVYSWADYARLALRTAADLGEPLQTTEVQDIPMASISAFIAARPAYSALATGAFESRYGQPLSTEVALREHLCRVLQPSIR